MKTLLLISALFIVSNCQHAVAIQLVEKCEKIYLSSEVTELQCTKKKEDKRRF
jgi:hypothetical protein